MTTAAEIPAPATWTHPIDEIAVGFCMDSYIAFDRLTPEERVVVAARLTARGLKPTEIANRTGGTPGAVHAALARWRTRDA